MSALQTSITCLRQEVKRRAGEIAMVMREKMGVVGVCDTDAAEVTNQTEGNYTHSLVTALSTLNY